MNDLKKIAMLVTATIVMAMMAASVLGDVFGGDFGEGEASSDITNSSLDSWEIIFHYDNSTQARNADYPMYEFQMDGEYVHLDSWIINPDAYIVEHTNVTAVLYCVVFNDTDGEDGEDVIYVPLTWDGATSEFFEGVYKAHHHGDYIIPAVYFDKDLTHYMGNCRVEVEMTPEGGSMTTDDLSEQIYQNVNDILMNPYITVMANSGLSFPNLVKNALNPAAPYPIIYTATSSTGGDTVVGDRHWDREGQGVVGDLSTGITDLVGNNDPTQVIMSNNIRFHTGSDPVNQWLTRTNLRYGQTFDPIVNGVHVVIGWADMGEANTNTAGYFNEQVFYELYYPGSLSDTAYSFIHSWLYAIV